MTLARCRQSNSSSCLKTRSFPRSTIYSQQKMNLPKLHQRDSTWPRRSQTPRSLKRNPKRALQGEILKPKRNPKRLLLIKSCPKKNLQKKFLPKDLHLSQRFLHPSSINLIQRNLHPSFKNLKLSSLLQPNL
jgi:hypothetical protein